MLYEGDCLEIMPTLADKSIDMLLCDLPYGITACDWDVRIPFEPLWEAYKRIIKPNGAIVLTASQPFTSMLVMSNLAWFKYEIIWNKTKASNFQLALFNPLRIHENILIFYKSMPTYNQQNLEYGLFKNSRNSISTMTNLAYRKKEHISTAKGFNNSLININSEHNPPHPTQKPVALFEYLIRTYTNEGDLVLDNCAGSCTTAIAAIKNNRHWICIEMLEKYCNIAQQRVDAENAQLKLDFSLAGG
jgi:site-specific DNA-methyltransferase (adenine-specific)